MSIPGDSDQNQERKKFCLKYKGIVYIFKSED